MIKEKLELTKKLLTDLVAFPVLGGQSNIMIADYIEQYLNNFGIKSEKVWNQEKTKYSLFCRIGPAVDGGTVLSGHMDVVPVKGQPWTNDPFTLMEKEAKLYGRGSADMKGFLACCLASVSYFHTLDLKRPLYFAFSYDEEIGCIAGPALVSAIKNFYQEKPEFAIIGEPSMLQPVTGHKGICVMETRVKASAGHSSRIRQEVSAIHIAADLIKWLDHKMHILVEAGNTDNRFYPNHSSIHVGTIHGGIAPNVIADLCVFQWDIRVIPADNISEILDDYHRYCRQVEYHARVRFPDTQIITSEIHPPVPALNTPDDLKVVDWIKQLTGTKDAVTVAYASEAGQFSEGGFQTVVCGPGDIAQAHRADEFISIDQLELCLQFLERLGEDSAV